MSDRETCLMALRGAGPTSIARLAALTGINREKVYRAVYQLRADNLARRLGRGSYDLTTRGRQVFAERHRQTALV